MRKLAFTCMAAALAIGSAAQAAEVAVSVNVFGLNDQNNQAPAGPSVTIAVVDRDGDGLVGFGFQDLNANGKLDLVGELSNAPHSTFLFDQDDWIIVDNYGLGQWKETTGGQEEQGFTNFLTLVQNYRFKLQEQGGTPGVNNGDHVFLFWFPNLPGSANAPGGLQPFGVIDIGALQGLPDVTGTLTFDNLTLDPPAALPAFGRTGPVPEPASLLLLLAGGAMIGLRRRNAVNG